MQCGCDKWNRDNIYRILQKLSIKLIEPVLVMTRYHKWKEKANRPQELKMKSDNLLSNKPL